MKIYLKVVLVGICLLTIPMTSFAALDWRIQWDEANSPHTARVYIFNPEETIQSFTLEIGDVAQTSDADPYAPYLIIGQDISLMQIAPSERKIFDIVVYQDIDPQSVLSAPPNVMASSSGSEQHQQQLRILGERYGTIETRQYPMINIAGIEPVVREEPINTQTRAVYRSSRGYWITALVDHDHIAEQLIRTGERMKATYTSIQQAVFYYTQGAHLSGEAAQVWQTAFPELGAPSSPGTGPITGDCQYFVTVVSANLSYYASSRAVTVGDILAPADPALAPVVVAEDVNFNVSANTATSKRAVRVYLLSQPGQPSLESEYVNVISHDSQIENVIRQGIAGNYHPCAIQDVIFYMKGEVPSLTIGQGLWDLIGGGGTPLPPYPDRGRSICLGNPMVQPAGQQASNMTLKNLAFLVGTVVPFGLVMGRKKRNK